MPDISHISAQRKVHKKPCRFNLKVSQLSQWECSGVVVSGVTVGQTHQWWAVQCSGGHQDRDSRQTHQDRRFWKLHTLFFLLLFCSLFLLWLKTHKDQRFWKPHTLLWLKKRKNTNQVKSGLPVSKALINSIVSRS